MTDSAWFSKRIDCPIVLLNRSVIHWCIYHTIGDRRSFARSFVCSLAHSPARDASVSLLLSGQISMRVARLHSENLGVESRWGQHSGGEAFGRHRRQRGAARATACVIRERLNNRRVPRDSKSAIDIGAFLQTRIYSTTWRLITDNGRHHDRRVRMRRLLALGQEGKQKVP